MLSLYAQGAGRPVPQVLNGDYECKLWALGMEPGGIRPNTLTKVMFAASVSGDAPPAELSLEEVDSQGRVIKIIGELRDNGQDGDLVAGDRVYSGTFSVTAAEEGFIYYRVTFKHGARGYVGESAKLVVIDFPPYPAPSAGNTYVLDAKTGTELIANEVCLSFKEGVSPGRIREIIAEQKASVAGMILPGLGSGFGSFQVRIPGEPVPETVYRAIAVFKAYPEVSEADYDGVSHTGETISLEK